MTGDVWVALPLACLAGGAFAVYLVARLLTAIFRSELRPLDRLIAQDTTRTKQLRERAFLRGFQKSDEAKKTNAENALGIQR